MHPDICPLYKTRDVQIQRLPVKEQKVGMAKMCQNVLFSPTDALIY
jgi:hypothetical protein